MLLRERDERGERERGAVDARLFEPRHVGRAQRDQRAAARRTPSARPATVPTPARSRLSVKS